jgi:hypothetical protein
VDMILNTSFNNKNMTFFTSTFHKYVELSSNLNKYIESKEFSR